MPARVVLVLSEASYADQITASLNKAGCDVATFSDPMGALDILRDANRIELLITSPDLAPSKPNGIALARMARFQRPDTKVMFIGPRDLARFAAGIGTYKEMPISVGEVVDAAIQMLASDGPDPTAA